MSDINIEQNHQSSFAAVGFLKGFEFEVLESISLNNPLVSLLTVDGTTAETLEMEGTAEPEVAGDLLGVDGTVPPPQTQQCSEAGPISPPSK
jgi:hypothetical protein